MVTESSVNQRRHDDDTAADAEDAGQYARGQADHDKSKVDDSNITSTPLSGWVFSERCYQLKVNDVLSGRRGVRVPSVQGLRLDGKSLR